MRIAFDYQIFFGQSYGGISRYFIRLAQELLNKEHGVRIFAPVYRNVYLRDMPRRAVSGYYLDPFPPKTARLINASVPYISRKLISGWKPDVVHETYYSSAPSAPKGCPTVLTVFDMIHELFPGEFPPDDSTAGNKRTAVLRADHVICISENTKADLVRLHGIQPEKISVVYLGFDKFASGNAVPIQTSPGNREFLLYVGQRYGYKNFSGFLSGMASSKKLMADFDIVAFGGGSFTKAESDLISSLGFAPGQVRQVSGDDALLGGFYGSARAFVYPSIYEGFGIPPLEAMAHDCPVISSNTSSMPEVIGDAAEYFDPSSTDDIRRAIESVVYSDARVEMLKTSGKAQLAKFSWSKCAEETLNIYSSLA